MLQGFRDFLARPFSPDMDAWGWFLFFGLLIVITTVWHLILTRVVE